MTAISHKLTCTTPGHPGQWFGILLLAVAGLGVPAESRAQEADRAALVALYNATGGEVWATNTNWLSSRPLSFWRGVSTDDDGRVTSLRLRNNRLTGPIPPELGTMAHLEFALLGSNNLTGSIPPELGNLTNLESLGLSSNNLTGSIPPELGNLTNLRFLNLNDNNLTGPLPLEFVNLVNLWNLNINKNGLCAPADAAFRAWLATLRNFVGDVCSADRAALVAFYNATGGGEVWATNTNWLSSRPVGWWYGVRTDDDGRVTTLRLQGNRLTGPIPPELGTMAHLEFALLDSNNLTGSIPPELGNLTNLLALGLGNTNLTGSIPPELGDLTNLRSLNLLRNNLTGSIPPELGRLSNLIGLVLSENNLTGSIPPELGDLTNLRTLWVVDNNLTGSIPPELGDLTNLRTLHLHINNLTGRLPSEFVNLVNLQFLSITRNDGLCAPADAEFLAWLAYVVFRGNTCSDAVEPKAPDEVQATVDAAVAAAGGLRAGGPAVTIDMSTLFSLGDGGSADTTFTARSSQPALVTAETTNGSLVLTPTDPQPSNLVGGAADALDGDPATVTITVTATRVDDTAEVEFTVTVTVASRSPFTDDPIVAGVTPVRAVHFTELRTRIDALREQAGLGRFRRTDPVLRTGVTPVRLVHLLELRAALGAAYSAAGRAAPRWTDAAPTAGTTPIRAAHLMELRAAVVALE